MRKPGQVFISPDTTMSENFYSYLVKIARRFETICDKIVQKLFNYPHDILP